jgi:hypothetical protein
MSKLCTKTIICVATVQKMGKKTSFLKQNYYILFNKKKVKNILLSKSFYLYKIQKNTKSSDYFGYGLTRNPFKVFPNWE